MKQLLTIAALLISTQAQADGFVCTSADGVLKVKVYNQTQPELGTRNAAVMVLSDARVGSGRRTIATFRDSNMTLSNEGADYVAKVDLRRTEISRQGEYVLGTRLGQLASLHLAVGFSYENPLPAGTLVEGYIVGKKRNGGIVESEMVCERYLRN